MHELCIFEEQGEIYSSKEQIGAAYNEGAVFVDKKRQEDVLIFKQIFNYFIINFINLVLI